MRENVDGSLVTPLSDPRTTFDQYDFLGQMVGQKIIEGEAALIGLSAATTAGFFVSSFDKSRAEALVPGQPGFVSVTQTFYNDEASPYLRIDESGARIYTQYDNAGRKIVTITTLDLDRDGTIDAADTDGDGIPDTGTERMVTSTSYDGNGNATTVTATTGASQGIQYDGAGRVSITTDANGRTQRSVKKPLAMPAPVPRQQNTLACADC